MQRSLVSCAPTLPLPHIYRSRHPGGLLMLKTKFTPIKRMGKITVAYIFMHRGLQKF
jgi:hypothetical protein